MNIQPLAVEAGSSQISMRYWEEWLRKKEA